MSKNIEDEIQAALHAQPATGTLDPRLDFFIKQAEVFIEDARQTILSKMPEGPYAEHKSVAYESMNQTILTCGWQVNAQIGSIDQSLALTKQAGEQQFSRCISRPQNTSEEALNRAWQRSD